MTPNQMDFAIYMLLCLVDCFHTVNLAFYACVRAALPQTPLNPHTARPLAMKPRTIS